MTTHRDEHPTEPPSFPHSNMLGVSTPTLREWRWNEGTQGWDICDYGTVVGFMSLRMQHFLVQQSRP